MVRYFFLIAFLAISLASSASELVGTVRDMEGYALNKVKVTLYNINPDAGTKHLVGSVTTDENGKFQFNKVNIGYYSVIAEKDRYLTSHLQIAIHDELRTDVVNVELELTQHYKVLRFIQMSSLIYCVLFGFVIFITNFLIFERPSSGVTLTAWGVVILCIGIGFYSWRLPMALLLAGFALTTSAILHWQGQAAARRRCVSPPLLPPDEKKAEVTEFSPVGSIGIAISDLKPYGEARFDGKIVEVKSQVGFLERNSKVVVVDVKEGKPVVDAVDKPKEASD